MNRSINRFLPTFPSSSSLRRFLLESLASTFPTRKSPLEQRKQAKARIGQAGLFAEEREFLSQRDKRSHPCLNEFLGGSVESSHLPRIGVVLSGGGYRAMIGGLGSLRGLKEIGIFDGLSYCSALSGSSWLISQLVVEHEKNPEKPFDFDSFAQILQDRVSEPLLSTKIPKELIQRSLAEKLAFDQGFSLTDIFSWALSHRLLGGLDGATQTLSDQRKSLKGSNIPFPIYSAINEKSMQFEFSPYEVGSGELSYFIPSWSFGRRFQGGASDQTMNEIPEPLMGLMMSVFGSAHCVSADRILDELSYASQSSAYFIQRLKPLLHQQLNLGTSRPFSPHPFNNPMFQYETNPLARDEQLLLLDAGTAFNIPIVPLLQPARGVEFLIVFDYSSPPESLSGLWVKLAAEYAQNHKLPFPDIYQSIQLGKDEEFYTNHRLGNGKNSSEREKERPPPLSSEQISLQRAMSNTISVFPGNLQQGIPTVLYFPLIRHSSFDSSFDPRENFLQGKFCSTLNFQYSHKEFDLLYHLTHHAVIEGKDVIKEVLWQIIQQKKEKIKNQSMK